MPKKFWSWHQATVNSTILTFICLHSMLFAMDSGDYFFDKTKIVLDDGRKIELKRVNPHNFQAPFIWKLAMNDKSEKELWQKNYSEDYDVGWEYPFFVRVIPHNYIYKHNKSMKIALSVWTGGNAPCQKVFMIEVLPKELKFEKIIPFYVLESRESVLKHNGQPRFTQRDCTRL